MAEYTTEVRSICEFYAGLKVSEGQKSVVQIIDRSRDKIFDFDYPMFDEQYKPVLETKILSHYYTREIGEETVGLWKHRLYTRLNEIMPKYNKLYEVEARKIDPMTNIFKKIEGNKKGDSESTDDRTIEMFGTDKSNESAHDNKDGTKNSQVHDAGRIANTGEDTTTDTTSYENYSEKLKHVDKYSDTPQSGIEGLSEGFLTNARQVNDEKTLEGKTIDESKTKHGLTTDSENDSTTRDITSEIADSTRNQEDTTQRHTSDKNKNNAKTTDEYVEQIAGYEGVSYSSLLKEYRDNILNIDLMIINELSDLFFTLW